MSDRPSGSRLGREKVDWDPSKGCAHGPKYFDGPWHVESDHADALAEATEYLKNHTGQREIALTVIFRRVLDD